MHHLLRDISLCIVTAWALGVLAQLARQPILLAYLVAGFLLGPQGVGWILNQDSITTIAELGLIFLLFMIGLEIDLKKVVSAGRTITLTGVVQISAGCLLGVWLFRWFGYPLGNGGWDALYLAVGSAMSSTVVIIKILYDKRELETLPGRITVGILVLQDLFAIMFLAVQPSLDKLEWTVFTGSLIRVAILVSASLFFSRFILPPIFRTVARLPELVLVGAIAWCMLMGELGERLHLSREMGALIAGVALSTFPYALDVTAKVTSLRDFFVTLFFVGLGMRIPMPTTYLFTGALLFAGFVLVSHLLTTFIPLYLMRQGLRTSLLPALNLSNASEFALVILGLGAVSKHIQPETAGIASIGFVSLATASTFGMVHSDSIVRACVPWLKRLGLSDLDDNSSVSSGSPDDASGRRAKPRLLILGFFRTASSLLEEIRRSEPEVLNDLAVVDFNPQVYAELSRRKIRVIYGDISQRETLLHAGVAEAETLICSVPNSVLKGITNVRLVRQLRQLNPNAHIFAPAEVLSEMDELYSAGANYVTLGRLHEAIDLRLALKAARTQLLDQKRAEADFHLKERMEVLP